MAVAQLYDRDFFNWTQCNAALLRAGQLDQADIQHIAEELEDMGRSERRALESRGGIAAAFAGTQVGEIQSSLSG